MLEVSSIFGTAEKDRSTIDVVVAGANADSPVAIVALFSRDVKTWGMLLRTARLAETARQTRTFDSMVDR